MKSVYVVTLPELGWDCIIGVFDDKCVTKEELEERFNEKQDHVIHHCSVEKDFDGWVV